MTVDTWLYLTGLLNPAERYTARFLYLHPRSTTLTCYKRREAKIYISSGTLPPPHPWLHLVFFDTQNPVKLAPFVKCWLWVDKLACLRLDRKPTVINHNYRVGLAHGSCINIPLTPPKYTQPPRPITSPCCSRWLGHRLEVSIRPVITAASFTPAHCLLFISNLLILNPSPPSGKIVI